MAMLSEGEARNQDFYPPRYLGWIPDSQHPDHSFLGYQR